MTISVNRRTILRYFEDVWNKGHIDLLDELLTPDYLNHSSSVSNPRPGPEDLKPIVLAMRKGMPDLHYEILDIVEDRDRVAVYTRLTGTHTGDFFGMPGTGRRVDVRQMQIEWMRNGRIWQHWRLTDELSMYRQLGQI